MLDVTMFAVEQVEFDNKFLPPYYTPNEKKVILKLRNICLLLRSTWYRALAQSD